MVLDIMDDILHNLGKVALHKGKDNKKVAIVETLENHLHANYLSGKYPYDKGSFN